MPRDTKRYVLGEEDLQHLFCGGSLLLRGNTDEAVECCLADLGYGRIKQLATEMTPEATTRLGEVREVPTP